MIEVAHPNGELALLCSGGYLPDQPREGEADQQPLNGDPTADIQKLALNSFLSKDTAETNHKGWEVLPVSLPVGCIDTASIQLSPSKLAIFGGYQKALTDSKVEYNAVQGCGKDMYVFDLTTEGWMKLSRTVSMDSADLFSDSPYFWYLNKTDQNGETHKLHFLGNRFMHMMDLSTLSFESKKLRD